MTKLPPPPATAPRKRPTQRRSAATVDAILEAAARILETSGYEGYTTNAVAATAGVSIGSLYQYFPNRESLTQALVERETAELLAAIEAIGDVSGVDGIQQILNIAVRHQLQRPHLSRFLDLEEARLPTSETSRLHGERAATILAGYLKKAGCAAPGYAIRDVMAITRGIVDAAGCQGETDEMALAHRVRAAVFGYLDMIARDPVGGLVP
ncbi:TetR family transcriptional regulator [Duganella sp. FT135W]|uniref:TetR family transcriptional regulator n=1 Tax=Duganella flavida TaxID=2692175 RepID=A0A6L8KFB2_9BURK|nr:TetR/AcrR family transcriptional regulator [Duganella flavida]MYM26149.1 TetR family transcriptional regulator [Duganella flavida]